MCVVVVIYYEYTELFEAHSHWYFFILNFEDNESQERERVRAPPPTTPPHALALTHSLLTFIIKKKIKVNTRINNNIIVR